MPSLTPLLAANPKVAYQIVSRIAFRQPYPEGAQAVAEFIAKIEKKKSTSSGFLGKDRSTTINEEWDHEAHPANS